jgi:hypothetical protein
MRLRPAVTITVLLTAAITLPAAAASAFPPPVSVRAVTNLIGRPDSGGNGNWAADSLLRDMTITRTGGAPGHWTFTATLTDYGSFQAIAGAFTPNQGAPYTGDLIQGSPSGAVDGSAVFSFTASQLPSAAFNAGVPVFEDGAPSRPDQTTSLWFEQAFPPGTVFGGPGIGVWGWHYATPACLSYTLTRFGLVPVITYQQWADTSADGAGQLPGDGNITSDCPVP